MMEVMRLSYEKSINLLKAKGVEFEAGLTDVEMGKIESTYKIEFPKSLEDIFNDSPAGIKRIL